MDLPGFYYDPAKKRYFRILQSGNNVMAGVVTPEVVASKKSEDQRSDCIKSGSSKSSQELKQELPTHNVVHVVNGIRIGRLRSDMGQTRILCGVVRRLARRSRHVMVLNNEVLNNEEYTGHDIGHLKHLLPSTRDDQIICNARIHNRNVPNQNGDVVQRIDISCIRQKRNKMKLKYKSVGFPSVNTPWLVTSLCLADTPNILYTTMIQNYTNVTGVAVLDSVCRLRSLDYDDSVPQSFHTYVIGKKWVWSSAWNDARRRFIIGTERKSLLFDSTTGRRFDLDTQRSDALSQAVSYTMNDVLYTGTRSGAVHSYKSEQRVDTIQELSSVCSLSATEDGHHLIAADFSGKIVNLDLRQKRIVLQYDGHVNNCAAFCTTRIDKSQRFLYAVGTDGVTRLWDVRTGELLKSVDSPGPVSKDCLPSVYFSDTFGRNAFPGLLLGLHDKLHFYSV